MLIYHWKEIAPGATFHAARTRLSFRSPGPIHGHDFAEVFWVERASILHFVNGQGIRLAPGSLVMMRPEDNHGLEAETGTTAEISNVAFPREIYSFLGRRYFADQAWGFWSGDKTPFTTQLEPTQMRLFNRWADALSKSPRTTLHIERFLLDLLAELLPHPKEVLDENTPDWLLLACEEITQPKNLAAGTDAFFRLAGRSREHVARICREYTGVTPTDYVNRARMNDAARQLEMSNLSILEIAARCGVENLSHFYKLFHAAHGITPRAYRLAHRRLL